MAVPAFNGIRGGTDFSRAVYDIADTIEQARAHALANCTYTWVGFFEEDATKSTTPATSGTGALVVWVVASNDGTRIYKDTFTPSNLSASSPDRIDKPATNLSGVTKLLRFEGVHMADVYSSVKAPTPEDDNKIDNSLFENHKAHGGTMVLNPTTFGYPLGSTSPKYSFVRILEFNPRGEASKIVTVVDPPPTQIGLGLQPARGNLPMNTNAAAILVNCASGATQIYR